MIKLNKFIKVLADKGDVFVESNDTPTNISIDHCINAIWQTQVCDSYFSAERIAQDTLANSGAELVSAKGKFWRRSKQALRNAILNFSDRAMSSNIQGTSPSSWSENEWEIHLEELRQSFSFYGDASAVPKSRSYCLFHADQARMLGQWFSLHNDSCHWTVHRRSMKFIVAAKGYMMRGIWSTKKPTVEINSECRQIHHHTIFVPKITDYSELGTKYSGEYAVRAMVQPLDNGLVALYNGYKATIKHSSFDFTTRTRHMIQQTHGDIMHTIASDFAKFFSTLVGGGVLGVKTVNSADSAVWVNGDKWYLVGDVNHPMIKGDKYNQVSFADVVALPNEWEDKNYGTDSNDYLDYGWNSRDDRNRRSHINTEYGLSWDHFNGECQ